MLKEIKFVDKCGKNRLGFYKNCAFCNNQFISRIDQPRKYCSEACSKFGRRKRVQLSCASCNKSFERKKCGLVNSKSGLYFCCRNCKDNAQKLGGIKEIQPSHYGTSTQPKYRHLFEEKDLICSRCGYNEFASSVQIHHKDKNRDNNTKENLMPLCANCHLAYHNNLWT